MQSMAGVTRVDINGITIKWDENLLPAIKKMPNVNIVVGMADQL